MKYCRNNKIPFFLYFLLYWVYYIAIWLILSILFIFIICLKDGESIHLFSFLLSIDRVIWLCLLLSAFMIAYYTMGSMVESISIDKENKTLKIIYYPLVFLKKEKVFFIGDDTFEYVYQSSEKTVLAYIRNFHWLYFNALKFYNKNKILKAIILHDVAGWNASQIKEINDELVKIKLSTD